MKLSTRVRYGMRALIVLARSDGSRTSEGIAQQEKLSKKYMDEILGGLRQGNVLNTKRGVSGGYSLAKDPSEVTLLEVVEILDGPTRLAPCVDENFTCPRNGNCMMGPVWERLNENLRDELGKITLAEILDQPVGECLMDGEIPQADCVIR